MRDCDPIEGVIIYSREYYTIEYGMKRGSVYYRDFGLYEPNVDAVFQFEINLRTIRKMKLQKINGQILDSSTRCL
jgi:hypothetical protein